MNVLDKAIKFATEAHSGALRKGTKIPYIVHPLETAAIAATMTVDEEVIAAAVLHDVIEDTPVTKEQLIREFGAKIAEFVCADSENKREDKPAAETWEIRKRETLNYIPNASRDEQIIILSDKLSNMRSIFRDYEDYGDIIWNKFNMKDKSMQGWYYRGIAERLDKVKEAHAYSEYDRIANRLFVDFEVAYDNLQVEKWYNEEIDQVKRQFDNDFDVSKDNAHGKSDDNFMEGLFYGKPKVNTIKMDHYSWIESEFLKWDEEYIKKSLRKSIKMAQYDGELPSCSEWENKSEFERKALGTLAKIVKSAGVLNLVDALNEVQKKLREAKLFENKKDIQIYERLKYELTECSIKEFEALKREVLKK